MNYSPGCRCVRCDRLYKVDILVPDALWERIKPEEGNLLCGCCIMVKLERLNEFDAFTLERVK
jgi:hypothetical protein